MICSIVVLPEDPDSPTLASPLSRIDSEQHPLHTWKSQVPG